MKEYITMKELNKILKADHLIIYKNTNLLPSIAPEGHLYRAINELLAQKEKENQVTRAISIIVKNPEVLEAIINKTSGQILNIEV